MSVCPIVSAIVHACADSPGVAIQNACGILRTENISAMTALDRLTGVLSKECLVRLRKSLKDTATTAKELALALASTAAGVEAGKIKPDIQLVWTGPDTPKLPSRDTLPQMLEMIGRASESILLVTFAAFKAASITGALDSALRRAVKVMVVVESSRGSAGQLTHDGWKDFPESLLSSGCVWTWPIARRPTNARGLPAKMHAKCLVIDGRETLVSSANLTDDAMERNVEVGLRCGIRAIARQITQKFDGLVLMGHLTPACPS